MKKYCILISILFVLIAACEKTNTTLSTSKMVECPKCPEKTCPTCLSCDESRSKNKPLIVDNRGFKIVDKLTGEGYFAYGILNPNDHKVLADIKTHCYDNNGKETISKEEKSFIEAQSEWGYTGSLGVRNWVANCPQGSSNIRVSADIIG